MIRSLCQLQYNVDSDGAAQVVYKLMTDAGVADLILREDVQMVFVPEATLFVDRAFAFNIADVHRS